MHLPLHVDGDVFEVNIVDFLLLEALRVFEPRFHEALFRERDLILQTQRYRGDGRRDEDKEAAERLLGVVPDERRAVAQDALKDLFPLIEWAFGGTDYANGFHARWRSEKRVCSTRYFPRYFELQTAAGEMSERRFVEFLDATATKDRLAAVVADVETDGLLPSLAARLDESVDRLPVANAAVLLPGMFDVAQKFAGIRGADPFNSPWLSAWRATSWFLKRIPEDVRSDLVGEALRQTKALSIAAMLIHLSDPADREEGDDSNFDPALNIDTVGAMKTEWLRLIRSRATDGDALIAEPDLMFQLHRWGKYAGTLDEPREWVTGVIRTDEGFASMVARMMFRGTSHSWGDRVSTPHNTFNRETIDDFIGIDVAKARCDAIDPGKFPEHEEALRTLRRFLGRWLGHESSDPFDL